ncbi:MAG: lipocalin-like domain-containing protein [Caldimonas sp.]
MRRRALILSMWGAAMASSSRVVHPEPSSIDARALRFPADFGAHPETRTEWWYATGSLQAQQQLFGFQVTFFRSATDVAPGHPSRFAASQLVFAHAALTDLGAKRLRHDERIARSGFGIASAATTDTDVVLHDWSFKRAGGAGASRYVARLASPRAGFTFDLTLDATQPVLLQGIGGLSQKGPRTEQSSRYCSEPQLAVGGTLTLDRKASDVQGRAWLDHEWSDTFLDPEAVGWDWIGMNLDDGSALTAFRLRRRDGSALYAGGSFRGPGASTRNFAATDLEFTAGRRWSSTVSKASYPVEWTIATPLGRYAVKALLDDQELDSRASTGAIYWEGLSDLLDAGGRRVGRGYLEMTGYAAPLSI